ncbi:hypothetical protein UPYG_G00144130 [Umbra pygmaea]|uniref:Uncharacterized protein n=1 Tax=Umbra pygmaea TaxID=75934 RepID=A0ABD0XC78_UMBPY
MSQPGDNSSLSAKTNNQIARPIEDFVARIQELQDLEDEKTRLETHLKILKQHEDYQGNVDELVQQQSIGLQHQIDGLARDQHKLEQELARCQDDVNQTRNKLVI